MTSQLSHRWQPGQSGNPTGRPRGFKAVAAEIMKETGDGAELVKFALDTWRNVAGNRSHSERWEAFCWLADRGIGKPVAMVELAAHIDVGAPSELDALDALLAPLTDAELEILARRSLLELVMPGTALRLRPPVIDVAAEPDPAPAAPADA